MVGFGRFCKSFKSFSRKNWKKRKEKEKVGTNGCGQGGVRVGISVLNGHRVSSLGR